ncbi:MAG: SLC13 family permease [Chloroflexi bacterium]|nr:SLC13 family permease [Chloroflexota bacterium]
MSFAAWWTALVLIVGIFFFARGQARLDVVAMAMLLALYLGGVLNGEQALSGFSASATITLAGIYVVSGGMRRTGATALLGTWLLRVGRRSTRRLTAVLLLATSSLSAFMANLAALVIMLPVGLRVSRASRISSSKTLLPLGLFTTLGGYLTLLGTPPNLIISDLLAQRTGQPFAMFEPAILGLPILLISLIWVLWFGQRLLPDIAEQPRRIGPNAQELEQTYHLEESFYRLRVRTGSDLVGRRLQELRLRERWGVNVVGVAPLDGHPYRPWPELMLDVNDEIIVQGKRADILQMANMHQLEPKGSVSFVELVRLAPTEMELAEVLVPPYSPLVGKTLSALEFEETYGLNVLAIMRGEEVSAQRLRGTPLQAGDRLLVHGNPARLAALRHGHELVVLSGLGLPSDEIITSRAPTMLAILGSVILLSVSGLVTLPIAALMGAFATILTNCTTPDQAYKDIDWLVVVLIAALLPLGMALQVSGLSALIGAWFAAYLGGLGPEALTAILFVIAVILTQILSNSVLALILTPITLDIAFSLGVNPQPFAMAILMGVSTSFLTPLTDIVNLLIRKPGGYRFRDYLMLNGPIVLVIALLVIGLVPRLWPF